MIFNKKINLRNGFTLVETLISSTIAISLLGVVTSFIWFTSNYTSKSMKRSELQDNVKLALDRVERQIQEWCSILPSYTPPNGTGITDTISSDENNIVFTVPVYKKITFEPAIMSSLDTNKNDVVFIEYKASTSKVEIGKLLFSYIPAPHSDIANHPENYAPRKQILRQVISSLIVNSLSDSSYQAYDLFSYFNNTSDTSSLTGSNLTTTTVVEINLWGKLDNPKYKLRDNFKTRIKLRNYIK